jgi:quercetin dioxygenase-like cupin family protein
VDRREAFADDHVWAGRSQTEAGRWSGWHVHPGHDTYVFQIEGRLRLEFGPGGTERVEGGPVTGERHGTIPGLTILPYLASRPISCTRWTAWPRVETPSLR